MKCEGFDRLIYLFLDGRLNQDEESKLKEHLSRCERCTKKLALLESVEGKARKIEIKEPAQEYWNTFSSRVREKIVEREEQFFAFGLRRALKTVFSFSPLKIKVAAGLVSIVLVFIVGKIYVDYRGQEILPPETVETERRQVDVLEGESTEELPHEEAEQTVEAFFEMDKSKREPTIPVPPATKGLPAEGAGIEKEVLEKKKIPPVRPEVVEEKPAAYAPALPTEAPVEAEKPSEQTIAPAALEPRGAGTEKKREEARDKGTGVEEEKTVDVERLTAKGEGEKSIMKDITASVRTISPSEFYVINKNAIPRMEEEDTLMHEQQLIRAIKTWKLHIKENPADSLSQEGYLQVATAYYLLAKLSQDTAVISEGSELIQGYLDQIEDQKTKEELKAKLVRIKALKER